MTESEKQWAEAMRTFKEMKEDGEEGPFLIDSDVLGWFLEELEKPAE